MKKQMFAIVFVILFFLPTVYAGVTYPLPSNIELLPTESVRFKFQVQATTSETGLVCTPSFEEEPEFIVEFDTTELVVAAKSRKTFYGTVTAPENLPYGNYEARFCVRCAPEATAPGAAVQINTCGLPIRINIVQSRTRDNLFVPEKPAEFPWVYVIVGAAMVVVLIIVRVYLCLRKKGTEKIAVVRKKKKKSLKKSSKKKLPKKKKKIKK